MPVQSDEAMQGKCVAPITSSGVLRLLPRLTTDVPEYDRGLLFFEVAESRHREDGIELVLAKVGAEEIPVRGAPAPCNVFTMKGPGGERCRYWITKKREIAKSIETLTPRVAVSYVLTESADARKSEETAAKWGAQPSNPEALAIHWMKALLAGDEADAGALAALSDQSKLDQYPVAAEKKPMLALPALRKAFGDTPSEHLFRWVYEVRPREAGRFDVLLPTIPGTRILAVEKQGETFKVVGIDPPPPAPPE
jgi:hypothetical protein